MHLPFVQSTNGLCNVDVQVNDEHCLVTYYRQLLVERRTVKQIKLNLQNSLQIRCCVWHTFHTYGHNTDAEICLQRPDHKFNKYSGQCSATVVLIQATQAICRQ